MNLQLISYFNIALSNSEDGAKVLSFEEVNAEAARYGWLVHPDCCNEDTLKWVREIAKTKYNKTFYKKWEDITSKTRFELLVDQLLHYASTYGTGLSDGEGYMPNHEDVVIPFKSFKVILPCSKRELFDRCAGMIKSGIAMEQQTQKDCSEYVVSQVSNWTEFAFSIDDVKNKESQATIASLTGVYPQDSFALLRCLVYKATGSTMLIKSDDMISAIRKNAGKISLGTLSEKQLENLSKIFLRFKPLFLAMKCGVETSPMDNAAFIDAARKKGIEVPVQTEKQVSNASVVNKLRKLAKKNHTPFEMGFWETVLVEKKNLEDVKKNVASISNFKKATLMQCIKMRLVGQSGQCYVIRNGKMFVREGYAPQKDDDYLMRVFVILHDALIESLKSKACKVRYPKGLNLAVPTSEKNFIGNYPMGTSVEMGDDHNVVGIYWHNDWGTNDFDLHYMSMDGDSYGWNAAYSKSDEDKSVIYSGDITNAPNGATELMYIAGQAPDGKFQVCRYSGTSKTSQFKFFVARIDRAYTGNNDDGENGPMVDPNDVVAEFMIPVDGYDQKNIAMTVDNRFVLMELSAGERRVPSLTLERVVVDKFRIKARSFLNLKEVLESAGFLEAESDDDKMDLDLTQLTKDQLIGLFS